MTCEREQEEPPIDQRLRNKRIYGRGYYDGLRAAENIMTPAKQRAAMQGQSGIALKVYEAVPIQEIWNLARIVTTLTHQTASRVDPHVVRGCLGKLVAGGLVRETVEGFQRIKVREQTPPQPPEPRQRPPLALANPEIHTMPDPAPPRSPDSPALDILASIAQRLREQSAALAQTAADLETAALRIEESNTQNAANLATLKQLQTLLKGLALTP